MLDHDESPEKPQYSMAPLPPFCLTPPFPSKNFQTPPPPPPFPSILRKLNPLPFPYEEGGFEL